MIESWVLWSATLPWWVEPLGSTLPKLWAGLRSLMAALKSIFSPPFLSASNMETLNIPNEPSLVFIFQGGWSYSWMGREEVLNLISRWANGCLLSTKVGLNLLMQTSRKFSNGWWWREVTFSKPRMPCVLWRHGSWPCSAAGVHHEQQICKAGDREAQARGWSNQHSLTTGTLLQCQQDILSPQGASRTAHPRSDCLMWRTSPNI